MKLGEKIRAFRHLKGYSQENMANALNLSTTGYAKIERGEVFVSFSKLTKIADELQIRLDDLINF